MGVKGLDQLDLIEATLGRELQEAAKDSIRLVGNKIVELLQENAPDNSGYLQQSIGLQLPIRYEDGSYVLVIEWEEYGTYQDAGVAGVKSGRSRGIEYGYGKDFSYKVGGKMPPTNVSTIGGQSLAQYATSKGISPFAVARSIFNKGLKATGWATNTIESAAVQSLIDEIATLIVKQYEK